jgi:hypothetical protein
LTNPYLAALSPYLFLLTDFLPGMPTHTTVMPLQQIQQSENLVIPLATLNIRYLLRLHNWIIIQWYGVIGTAFPRARISWRERHGDTLSRL